VAPGGRYVSVDDGTPGFTAADLAALAELVDAGAIAPVIDRTYPLERIAEAHRYVETDHKRGNVVVTVA
jgi:alcohol dehydrogenase